MRMNRKDFIKGAGGFLVLTGMGCHEHHTSTEDGGTDLDAGLTLDESPAYDEDDFDIDDQDDLPTEIECAEDDCEDSNDVQTCTPSPEEIEGPFPNRDSEAVRRTDITEDMTGVPLELRFQIVSANGCEPIARVEVDVWHCDAHGNYSEYRGQQDGDFRHARFLRGRGTTDDNGEVRFMSVYPGWYPGRAPHIHVEVSTEDGRSLLVTQTSLPDRISEDVYGTDGYRGTHDTLESEDRFFSQISLNQPSSIEGNTRDGFVLVEELVVRVDETKA